MIDLININEWGDKREDIQYGCFVDKKILRETQDTHVPAHIQTQYQTVHILINSSRMIKHDSLSSHPRFHKEETVFQAADTKSLIITFIWRKQGST